MLEGREQGRDAGLFLAPFEKGEIVTVFHKKIDAELEGWIQTHESELSELVFELVKYPSISTGIYGDERYPFGQECARLAEGTQHLVEQYGLVWQNHDYYAVSATYGSPVRRKGCSDTRDRPRIAFFSHLDVVPAGTNGWKRPPFEPYEKNGWIFGRGAIDNKGPFSSVLFALRFLAEHEVQLRHDITLYGGFDEEVGMDDAKWIAEHLEAARYNLVSDCSFPVCVAEKGILEIELARTLDDEALVDVQAGQAGNAIPDHAFAKVLEKLPGSSDTKSVLCEASGISAHAAFPEGSKNAFVELALALSANRQLGKRTRDAFAFIADTFSCTDGSKAGVALHDDFLGDTTCVPTVVHYENGTLRILVNLRYPAIKSSEWVLSAFAEYLNSNGFEIASVTDLPARPVHEDSALVNMLTAVVNKNLGANLKPYAMGGATHARWIPGALGFGPGRKDFDAFPADSGLGHEANEAVCIEHLKQAIAIYVQAILRLDDF